MSPRSLGTGQARAAWQLVLLKNKAGERQRDCWEPKRVCCEPPNGDFTRDLSFRAYVFTGMFLLRFLVRVPLEFGSEVAGADSGIARFCSETQLLGRGGLEGGGSEWL